MSKIESQKEAVGSTPAGARKPIDRVWNFDGHGINVDGQRFAKLSKPLLLESSGEWVAMSREEYEQSAKLMAAAPSMLDALEELVAEFDRRSDEVASQPGYGGLNDTGGMLLARDAISRAKGGDR